jgi:hypothetical protein
VLVLVQAHVLDAPALANRPSEPDRTPQRASIAPDNGVSLLKKSEWAMVCFFTGGNKEYI